MGQQVTMSAVMMCSFGLVPSNLVVTPENLTNVGGKPAATIMDNIPMKNIMPFGMCNSPANPTVAAATAAALGALTPMPCIPVTAAPWAPGSATVMIANKPALNNSSKCMCQWGGVIQIQVPGQFQTNIP
ncbi:MAG: DUF4280 domain-containing protein [Burkholderiales bacterium]|nr:DUF4280 domain-containing protein [Anaerolineae bacterium]